MPDDSAPRPSNTRRRRPLRRLLVTADSYGFILLLVVITYIVAVALPAGHGQSAVMAVQIATVWLTMRTAQAPRAVRVVAATTFAGIAVLALLDIFLPVDGPALAAAFISSALLYLLAPVMVVRDLGSRRTVDRETVLGAIAGYLFVGMCFAFVYRAIGIVQTTPFFGVNGPGDSAQVLFFSFITLTTTGYGDLVPATNPGQSLAVLEAVLGQLFLVTAVAKIITAWQPRGWHAPDGPDHR